MAEQLANNAVGTLASGITATSTTIPLNAGQGAAFPSSGNFRLIIDNEIMIATARAGDNITVPLANRGAEGTAAAIHNSGATVSNDITVGGLTQFIIDHSVQASPSIADGEFEVYRSSDTSWQRSSIKQANVAGLAPGTVGQYLATLAGPVVGWTTPPVIAPTHLPGMLSGTGASSALVANTVYLIPIVNVVIATSISRILFEVGTASGNMEVGIYSSDDEITFTKLFSTGTFVVPAAGTIQKSITQQTITPVVGRRWYYAFVVDNGTAAFVNAAGVGSGGGTLSGVFGVFSKASVGIPLPASLTSMTSGASGKAPVVHGAV